MLTILFTSWCLSGVGVPGCSRVWISAERVGSRLLAHLNHQLQTTLDSSSSTPTHPRESKDKKRARTSGFATLKGTEQLTRWPFTCWLKALTSPCQFTARGSLRTQYPRPESKTQIFGYYPHSRKVICEQRFKAAGPQLMQWGLL